MTSHNQSKTTISLFAALGLACCALSPGAQAVLPAPDGGYPGRNTAEGEDALFSLTTGQDNTAIGFNALFNNTKGGSNTAVGKQALFLNTSGDNNTAVGNQALFVNTSGDENTAIGAAALASNTTGHENTAVGVQALQDNETGKNNTAVGDSALLINTEGDSNTAVGFESLVSNQTGVGNTASGAQALFGNTTSNFNTAVGFAALLHNTTINGVSGDNNTAVGVQALFHNTTGDFNTAEGFNALLNNTGNNNIAIGSNAGSSLSTGDNNIDIGNVGVAGESNKIRIGTKGTQKNTFIAGISGVTVAGGVGVIIDNSGHLGTVVSSERFKDGIKPMDKASEAILALQPVTFRYKQELDPDGIPQFGLVAEQVEKVNPALVARDDQGKVYTVRYEAVNAMLLNEFLKEHRKVQEQEATIVQLKKDFQATATHQQEQIEALTAGLQKVSAQLELNKPAPQMVGNNH